MVDEEKSVGVQMFWKDCDMAEKVERLRQAMIGLADEGLQPVNPNWLEGLK